MTLVCSSWYPMKAASAAVLLPAPSTAAMLCFYRGVSKCALGQKPSAWANLRFCCLCWHAGGTGTGAAPVVARLSKEQGGSPVQLFASGSSICMFHSETVPQCRRNKPAADTVVCAPPPVLLISSPCWSLSMSCCVCVVSVQAS